MEVCGGERNGGVITNTREVCSGRGHKKIGGKNLVLLKVPFGPSLAVQEWTDVT